MLFSIHSDARPNSTTSGFSTALFTGNASVQWYDQLLLSNVSRIRDAQVSLQLDHSFGRKTSTVSPTLSAGYYFQYMVDKALIALPSSALAPGTSIPLPGNASELLNATGPIHLGQAKISFSIRNSGLNIPIALTFSNRTPRQASPSRSHWSSN